MTDNPSLKAALPEAIEQAYGNALIEAEAETGLPEASLPSACPWSLSQIMDANFWPD